MKRAFHRLLCGDAEAKFREHHMEEILHIMQQDKQTLLPKLLDLPGVKKRGALATAAALLANLPLLGLSEGDAAWVRILNVSVKEHRSPDETRELVHLMAGKKQGEYLARYFQHLHLREMLQALEIDTLSAMYQMLKVEGVDKNPAKRRRIAGEEEKQSIVLVATALMEKLESRFAAGDRHVALQLRELYADQLEVAKLADLVITSHEEVQLPTLAEEMDLSLGVKLLDKISQSLAGWNPQPTLSECLSCFAVQIGKRHEKNGALQKASECFRQAMRFHFNKEARGLLTDVLLACHSSKHHAPAINSCELLNLLAEEGRWETLVQKWSALEGCAEKTLMWTTDQVDQLARGFQMAGDQKAAALLYVNQGLVKEAAGYKHEAFAAFRKAYNVGDNAEKSAESGLTRLAVEVGRVQDAATDLLSPLLGGTDEARQRVHTCFKLLQDYVDLRVGAGRPGPGSGPEPKDSPIHELHNMFVDSQDGDCIIERKPAEAPSLSAAPATPLSVALATPLWQASNWTQKAGQLREQHPDRVPTICMPALDPNRPDTSMDYFKKPWKFLLKEDATSADLKRQIQKRLMESGPSQSSQHILGAASEVQPSLGNAQLIGHLYERHKRDDCLYLKFTLDKYASGGLRLELFLA